MMCILQAVLHTLFQGVCLKEVKDYQPMANQEHFSSQEPAFESSCISHGQSMQWPLQQVSKDDTQQQQQQSTEADQLEQFSRTYQNWRLFSHHPQHEYFTQIFQSLVQHKLGNPEWIERANPENILRVFICLRIMLRDHAYQKMFYELKGVHMLSQYLHKATDSYLTYGDGPFVVDILKEMTNIFQKLSAVTTQRGWLVSCDAHKALVLLLSANDVVVLHCTLHALISLAQSPEPRTLIAELNSIEVLLHILQDYDMLSKQLAATLLRLLCGDQQAREMVKVHDGSTLLLSLLHADSTKLLWNVVWCLVQLAEDEETSNDIRQLGGIPLLLTLLHERKLPADRAVTSGVTSTALRSPGAEKAEEMMEHKLSLKSACCACLT